MNFLMRSASTYHASTADQVVAVNESSVGTRYASKESKPKMTLEGLIADDPFYLSTVTEERSGEMDGGESENAAVADSTVKKETLVIEDHLDVSEGEGWIIIPNKGLSDTWNAVPDINSLRSLDRSFVFPGEQVHILACLSACKQETEIITPFKVAAVMHKNGMGQNSDRQNGHVKDGKNTTSGEGEASFNSQVIDQNSNEQSKYEIDQQKDITASESILRMEDHKKQTEMLLQRFVSSHFFVRIAESGEPLWSRRSAADPDFAEMDSKMSTDNGIRRTSKSMSRVNALIDTGYFDANVSGGVARNTVNCFSLSNGDIVVLLQVNVAVSYLRDPTIEILQFERYQERNMSPKNHDNFTYTNYDPCGELLKWLIPLDNSTLPPPARSLSPPSFSSVGGASQRSISTGSQLLSHIRSYSMSSLPQSAIPPTQPVQAQSSKPSFDLEDWSQYSSQKMWKNQKTGNDDLLSFRGLSLERERFSVRCGLEGIFTPGRRWRRKVEIIQPVEIHSFAADCNTDDLLCVQIKNVSPAHAPDIIIFIDSITIVFEEASKSGPPSSLPITCIEAGDGHSLPNLPLRRGEEHSFVLKTASSMWKNLKVHGEKVSSSSSLPLVSNTTTEGRKSASNTDQYAIMVSCRCNYTESRLFFKQQTSWQPRILRDLMISVASEMSGHSSANNERVSQLPVQVLTLQASNLTSEDLTLTVLAPASFISPPSVGSLGSSPTAPMSPFVSFPESTGTVSSDRHGSLPSHVSENHKQNGDGGVETFSFNEHSSPISDVIPNTGLGCTHLWLQSRVPLGCVPAQSTATIKLELLPLTDGIIKLDTLRIDVKEKGLTYIPEYSLKINATSSISTGII